MRIMTLWDRISRLWTTSSLAVGLCFLVILAVIGTTDVIGTALFNRPVTGAMEASSLCYASLTFLGLPYAQRQLKHITSDVITCRLPPRIANICSLFGLLCTFAFLAFLSARTYELVARSLLSVERESGPLMLPVYPFKMLALLGVLGAALEAGRLIVKLILEGRITKARMEGDA